MQEDYMVQCLWMVADEDRHFEIWDIIFEEEGIVAEEELYPLGSDDYILEISEDFERMTDEEYYDANYGDPEWDM